MSRSAHPDDFEYYTVHQSGHICYQRAPRKNTFDDFAAKLLDKIETIDLFEDKNFRAMSSMQTHYLVTSPPLAPRYTGCVTSYTRDELETLTTIELRAICMRRNVAKYYKMSKDEMINSILVK